MSGWNLIKMFIKKYIQNIFSKKPGLTYLEPNNTTSKKEQIINSTKYDMVKEHDEHYYAKQYMHWILQAIKTEGLPLNSFCLDLGCGQGRVAFPLAKHFKKGKVIGVDFSYSAIKKANDYSLEENLENVEFSVSSIKDAINHYSPSSFSVIIMNEVTFYYPEWVHLLEKIISILKPGGLLVFSFRSQYFNALHLVKNRLFSNIDLLLNKRIGSVFNGPVIMSWNKSDEIRELFTRELIMNLLNLVGIGCCSGIKDDPHEGIIRPSLLSKKDQHSLMRLEIELGQELPDAGRYMLAIAKKK